MSKLGDMEGVGGVDGIGGVGEVARSSVCRVLVGVSICLIMTSWPCNRYVSPLPQWGQVLPCSTVA